MAKANNDINLTSKEIEKKYNITFDSILLATQMIDYDTYCLIAKAFGDNEDTWSKVFYVKTGLNSVEQYIDEIRSSGDEDFSYLAPTEIAY